MDAVVVLSRERAETAEEPPPMQPDKARQAGNASAKTARRTVPLFSLLIASVRSGSNVLPLQPGGMKEHYDRNRVNDW